MTRHKGAWMALGAVAVVVGVWVAYNRLQATQAASVTLAPADANIAPDAQFGEDLSDLPPDLAITWFQPQLTVQPTANGAGAGSAGEYVPLFGFIGLGGGVPSLSGS